MPRLVARACAVRDGSIVEIDTRADQARLRRSTGGSSTTDGPDRVGCQTVVGDEHRLKLWRAPGDEFVICDPSNVDVTVKGAIR
jgi:hypothetical protein